MRGRKILKQNTLPHYDLNLIRSELLNAEPHDVHLGPEEVLIVRPWWQPTVPFGILRYVFWLALILVVSGLLFVIARLLPQESA